MSIIRDKYFDKYHCLKIENCIQELSFPYGQLARLEACRELTDNRPMVHLGKYILHFNDTRSSFLIKTLNEITGID